MYSVFCAAGVIFVIALVPETKGRDLNSIAQMFASKEKPPTGDNFIGKTQAIKEDEAECTKL